MYLVDTYDPLMIQPDTTYQCRGCWQLLPFDHECRVPDSCVQRCEGRCDWVPLAADRNDGDPAIVDDE